MNLITSFEPDATPLKPGIAMSVTNVYPAENGCLRAMPTVKAFSNALDSACLGCFAFQDLNNNFRTIAGTATKLWELNNLTWLDVSLVTGYQASKWRFAGWGDYILAVNGVDELQVQTAASTDFADLAAAPIAKYITASNNFVILANIASNTNRIQWCAQGNYTDWTPSLSTQAGYYDLSDTPGKITGLAWFRDNIVVFKERGMYLGTYVGPPYIWSFQSIQTHSGTYSQETIIEHRRGIYFAGVDNFYYYDGTQPKGVGFGLRWWFQNTVDKNYLGNMLGVYDGKKRLIMWFYPTNMDGTGKPVEAIIYDYRNERWGKVEQEIEAALVHWTPGITYDTLGEYFKDLYYTKYPAFQNDDYVKATSKADTDHWPFYATDPLKSLVGPDAGNSWASDTIINQRFHLDLGEARVINQIYYENYHDSGGDTIIGVKTFTFWGSNNANSFAELTYGVDTGWTELTCSESEFVEHTGSNIADPKYITVTNTTEYRYYAFKFADNYGDTGFMGSRRIELQTNYGGTYTELENEAPYYDSPWWSAKSFGLAVVDIDHKMGFFVDTPGTAQVITGDSGNLQGYFRSLKAWPYFNIEPTSCTISSLTKTKLGGATTTGTAQSLKSDGSVDLDCTGKFTALQLDMTGDWEIVGFETGTKPVSVN